MSADHFRGDDVGPWTEIKLQFLEKYVPTWAKILNSQTTRFTRVYVDGFAGAGEHRRKGTDQIIAGSPKIALETKPPFDELHFVDLRGDKLDALKVLCAGRAGAFVHSGDANEVLLAKVFPRCRHEDFRRALCLLDPYGLQVDWKVLQAAAKTRATEVVYHLSAQAINRNIRRGTSEAIQANDRARFTALWGDETWQEILFERSPGLFEEVEEQRGYEHLARAFRERLLSVAGFQYVAEPLLLKNSTNAPLYWLFFAGPNATGARIVKDIFDQYR